MKPGLGFILLTSICILTSCSSISEMTLNVVRPAEITLPVFTRTVTLVNLSKKNEGSEGVFIDAYGSKRPLRLEYTDPSGNLVQMLNDYLGKSGYFSNISLFTLSDRTNLLNKKMTDKELDAIRDSTGNEMVLVLSDFYIEPTLRERWYNTYSPVLTLDMVAHSKYELYAPDNKYETISYSDTLYWDNVGEIVGDTEIGFSLDNCIKDMAGYTADHLVKLLVPYNESVKRFYFTSSDPLMKDAAIYWKQGKYEDASYLWEYAWENSKKNKKRAKAAANLALYYELQDNYSTALEWANRSFRIFSLSAEKNTAYIRMLKWYIGQLEKRIKDDDKLRFQLI